MPVGVGIAFAEQYKKQTISITFMGDGAVRQGATQETLNLAMLYRLPIIFVIENNGYAMGISVERSSNVRELYRLGSSYAMDAERLDVLNTEVIHRAVERAAVKARNGIRSLLEFITYCYRGHSV